MLGNNVDLSGWHVGLADADDVLMHGCSPDSIGLEPVFGASCDMRSRH